MSSRHLLWRYAQVAGGGLVLLGISEVMLNLPDDSLVVDSFRLLKGFVLVYAGLSSRFRVQCCALAWPE